MSLPDRVALLLKNSTAVKRRQQEPEAQDYSISSLFSFKERAAFTCFVLIVAAVVGWAVYFHILRLGPMDINRKHSLEYAMRNTANAWGYDREKLQAALAEALERDNLDDLQDKHYNPAVTFLNTLNLEEVPHIELMPDAVIKGWENNITDQKRGN